MCLGMARAQELLLMLLVLGSGLPCINDCRAHPQTVLQASGPSGCGVGENLLLSNVIGDFCQELERPNRTQRAITDHLKVRMVPFIEATPAVPLQRTTPPEDEAPDCRTPRYARVLTGRRRPQPVRVVDFVPFATELDLLEMRLWELDRVVDVFVVSELEVDHKRRPKELFFRRNSRRFQHFTSKIFHVPITLEDLQGVRKVERFPRRYMVEKYVQKYGIPAPNDLLMHGDLDEFPGTTHLHMLKHCIPKKMPLESTAINYRYTFNHAQTTDWPGLNPFGLRFPNIFNYQHFLHDQRSPRWYRNKGLGTLPAGGMHMSWVAYLPAVLLKYVMNKDFGFVPDVICPSGPMRLQAMQDMLNSGRHLSSTGGAAKATGHMGFFTGGSTLIPVQNTTRPALRAVRWQPWVAKENPKRYPYFFGTGPGDVRLTCRDAVWTRVE